MLSETPAAAGIATGPAAARRRVVHKFGGSSLADAGCFRRVAEIVDGFPEQAHETVRALEGFERTFAVLGHRCFAGWSPRAVA